MSSFEKLMQQQYNVFILNTLIAHDYIYLRDILKDGGSLFFVAKHGNLIEISMKDFVRAKRASYRNEIKDSDDFLWKSANPKSKRPHYMKRNTVCMTCRTTATEETCHICGEKTVITNYQIPPKRAIKKWEKLKTIERR